MCMVIKFWIIDIVVGINFYIDILLDFVVLLVGFIGIVVLVNLDLQCKYLLVFELVYGSVFDIMGKGIVNFIGVIWVVVDMFVWVGEKEVVDKIMVVIVKVCQEGCVMCDMGGEFNMK